VLTGGLPWQLQLLFEIQHLNENGALVEYWLALAITTMLEHTSSLDPISKYVPVRNPPTAFALQDFSLGNIVGCVHVIPEIATSSKTGDGQNERWIVNSHIHLAT
jgi:hypothetical protein